MGLWLAGSHSPRGPRETPPKIAQMSLWSNVATMGLAWPTLGFCLTLAAGTLPRADAPEALPQDASKYADRLFPKGPGTKRSYAHENKEQPAHYLFLDEGVVKRTGQRVVAYTLHTNPVDPGEDGQFWPGLALLSKDGARVLQRVDLVSDLKGGTDIENGGTDLSIYLTPFLIGDSQILRVQVFKVLSGNGRHTDGLDLFYSLGADGRLARALSVTQGAVSGKCGWCCGGGLNLRWWAQDLDGDGAAEIIRRTRGYTRIAAGDECKNVDLGTPRWRAYRLSNGILTRIPKLPRPFRISRDAVDLGGIWPDERPSESRPK